LENKNGKYGTLVLVRGNIKVKEEKTYFQIRNTKISMELINKKNFDKIDTELIQFNAIRPLIKFSYHIIMTLNHSKYLIKKLIRENR